MIDYPDVRDTIRRALGLGGYKLRTSANAVEAVNQLDLNPVQVVITDMVMPQVHGVNRRIDSASGAVIGDWQGPALSPGCLGRQSGVPGRI